MNISKEAIEAAARALFMRGGHAGEFDGHPVRPMYMNQARAVLEAAAPLLMAQALREAAADARFNLGGASSGHTSSYSVRKWLNEAANELEQS